MYNLVCSKYSDILMVLFLGHKSTACATDVKDLDLRQ